MSSFNVAFLLEVLTLPKHLQVTALALKKLGFADASQVAAETGRMRAIESSHLNMLVLLKFATRTLIKPTRGYMAHPHVYFMLTK